MCWDFVGKTILGGVEVKERREDTSERSDVEWDNYWVLKSARAKPALADQYSSLSCLALRSWSWALLSGAAAPAICVMACS